MHLVNPVPIEAPPVVHVRPCIVAIKGIAWQTQPTRLNQDATRDSTNIRIKTRPFALRTSALVPQRLTVPVAVAVRPILLGPRGVASVVHVPRNVRVQRREALWSSGHRSSAIETRQECGTLHAAAASNNTRRKTRCRTHLHCREHAGQLGQPPRLPTGGLQNRGLYRRC